MNFVKSQQNVYRSSFGNRVDPQIFLHTLTKMLAISLSINRFPKIRMLREAEMAYYAFPVGKQLAAYQSRRYLLEFTFCESYVIQKLA